MTKNEPLLEKAIESIRTEYAEAKKRVYIRKPLSYAVYQTWKMVDKIEREKNEKENVNDGSSLWDATDDSEGKGTAE